jgi:hypothetical protein
MVNWNGTLRVGRSGIIKKSEMLLVSIWIFAELEIGWKCIRTVCANSEVSLLEG